MYIYQLCEIAQMVEVNAHGLVAFFSTLKTVSAAILKYGKEYSTKIVQWVKDTFTVLKVWAKNRLRAYFVRKDLS